MGSHHVQQETADIESLNEGEGGAPCCRSSRCFFLSLRRFCQLPHNHRLSLSLSFSRAYLAPLFLPASGRFHAPRCRRTRAARCSALFSFFSLPFRCARLHIRSFLLSLLSFPFVVTHILFSNHMHHQTHKLYSHAHFAPSNSIHDQRARPAQTIEDARGVEFAIGLNIGWRKRKDSWDKAGRGVRGERERKRRRRSSREEGATRSGTGGLRLSLFVIVVLSFLNLFEHDCSLFGPLLLIQHSVDLANASRLKRKVVERDRERSTAHK